ncbi:hypothetical protein D9M71_656470 [compost metagenome]
MLFALEDVADPAGKGNGQIAEHGPADGAHAGDANPAGLLIGGRGQFAVVVVVKLRRPLFHTAAGLPALQLIDKTPVSRSEILRAQVQCAGIGSLAGHASAAAVALVE